MGLRVRPRSIRGKLLFAFLIATVPILCVQIADHLQSRGVTREMLLRQERLAAMSMATGISGDIAWLKRQHRVAAATVAASASPTMSARVACGSLDAMNTGLTRTSFVPIRFSRSVAPGTIGATTVDGILRDSRLQPTAQVRTVIAARNGLTCSLITRIDWRALALRVPSSADYLPASAYALAGPSGSVLCTMGSPARVSYEGPDLWRSASQARGGVVQLEGCLECGQCTGSVARVQGEDWYVVFIGSLDATTAGIILHQKLWIVASVVAALVGCGLLVVVGNRLAHPMRRLAHAASALAVGDYRKRVRITRRDELGVLGDSFNSLGESLVAHEEKMRGQREILAGMAEASRVVSSTLDIKECARSVVRSVCAHLGASAAALYLLDRSEGAMNRASYSGERPSAGWERLASHTSSSGEYLVMSEQNHGGGLMLVGVPLSVRGEPLGALVCRFSGVERDDLRHGSVRAEALTAFGVHTSAAIANAQAYSRSASYSEVLEDWVEHLSAVTQVTDSIAPALNLDEALDALANATLEVLNADECTILLPDTDGNLMLRCTAGNIAATRRQADRPVDPKQSEAGRAFLEKRAISCPDVLKSSKRTTREIALQTGARGLLSVPLVFQDQAIGVLSVCSVQPREFTAREIRLLSSIGLHAAVMVRNAGLYSREAAIAETLQRGLVPQAPERHGDLTFAGRYFPAFDEARVGGDFFDVVELPEGRTGVVMADVSGKGLAAAIHLAETKYLMKGLIHFHPNAAGRILSGLNEVLNSNADLGFFVTVFYGIIDPATETISYASAGHPPAVLVSRSGKMHSSLSATGIPIGTGYPCEYSTTQVEFRPSDLLLLYTDGVIETPVDGEPLDVEGLHRMIFEAGTQAAAGVVDYLSTRLNGGGSSVVKDDVAMLAVSFDRKSESVDGGQSGQEAHLTSQYA